MLVNLTCYVSATDSARSIPKLRRVPEDPGSDQVVSKDKGSVSSVCVFVCVCVCVDVCGCACVCVCL